MPETLLKRWNNWQDGVGHPIDEGGAGMHTANKILGLRGELRPAPVATAVTVDADPGHHFQYFFEEAVTTGQTPAFDAGSADSDTAASTLSWSHTVADKDNRILIVSPYIDDTGAITFTITYDGDPLTFLCWRSVGSSPNIIKVGIWYKVAPTVGTGTVVITPSAAADLVGIAHSWYKVDQSGPFGDFNRAVAIGDAGPATVDVVSTGAEVVIDAAGVINTVQTMAEGANQTSVLGGGVTETVGDIRGGASYETGAAPTTMSWTLGGACTWATCAVPLVGIKPGPSYLYAQRGKKSGSSSTVKVNKVSLANTDFANLETGQHDLTPLTVPGQSVRYHAYRWFPMGDDQKARRLQVVGSGAVANDTLDATATALGADHFANLGSQVVASLVHSGNDDGGMRILKEAGDIGTEVDWGPAWPVGDRTERAAGLRALAGMGFVLNVEGLYSFNKSARSGLIFEDYRAWRHAFDNISIVPWMGGLALSSPTGLVFWEPGKLPINVGLNADIGSSVLSPSGPPGLRGGRYHGLAVTPDFLYNIYQPDITSTTVNVMVSYPREPGNPYDLIHQQLGTTTLQDADHMLGCFVSVSSKPLSAEYVTPTLWYGNADDLSYVVLGTTASPFRTRADTHVVEAAGDAYMSELLFEKPTEISQAIVYTQNMASGDEWQLKVLADGEEETNLGPPLKRNGRHVIKVDRHDVYRLMLHVNWATSVTTARAAPSIQRIELYYGDPGGEGAG